MLVFFHALLSSSFLFVVQYSPSRPVTCINYNVASKYFERIIISALIRNIIHKLVTFARELTENGRSKL